MSCHRISLGLGGLDNIHDLSLYQFHFELAWCIRFISSIFYFIIVLFDTIPFYNPPMHIQSQNTEQGDMRCYSISCLILFYP